jgi:polysaccharide deacetylase 2 family uncharacterized protein YibQ
MVYSSSSFGHFSKKKSRKKHKHNQIRKTFQSKTYFTHVMNYFKSRIQSSIQWATEKVHFYLEKHQLLVRK